MSLSTGLTTITDGPIAHRVNLLGPRPAGRVRQAIVLLQAFDELTGGPVRVPIRVTTQTSGLSGQAGRDGVGGLVGVPFRAFPDLDTVARSVDVRVDADGYLPWSGTANLPARPGFPTSFAGDDLGRIDLHRQGVVLEVHAFRLTPQGSTVPVGGADVRLTRIWRSTADLGQPGMAPKMLGTPLGTSQPWPIGTAIDSVGLVPVAGPVRTLAASAAVGDTTVGVDRAGSFVPGDVVGIDLADTDRREYLPLRSIPGSVDPDSPAVLDLDGAVRVAHAVGAGVRRVNAPAPAPADTTVTVAADAGDRTVFVASTAPFASVEMIRAADPSIVDEYLDGHLYRATTGAGGVARLPQISRVAAVEITALQAGLTATARFSPDYLDPVNTVALTLH